MEASCIYVCNETTFGNALGLQKKKNKDERQIITQIRNRSIVTTRAFLPRVYLPVIT